jgi:putative MATE family efflux protein
LRKRNLTEGNISQQLYKMTVPMIGGILAIMSMNIVDTYYVGQLGTRELTAMSFTIPIISILLSLAFGIGIGTSSVIARAIGAQQHTLVQAYCTQAILIALIVAICFAVLGYHFMDPIFTLLGAPQDLFELIHEFMDIWFLASFVVVIPMVGNSAIRAAGNTKLPSMVMISVAIVNMILDPILIFGLLGFPKLGLAGAAISTVCAYSIALVIGLYVLIKKFDFLSLKSCYGRVLQSWQAILKIAVPAVGTNLIAPLSIAITTWLVARFSPESVAGFGVASRIEAIFLVVIMGLTSIMGPFVGQNWGAEKHDRVFEALKMSFKFVALWGLGASVCLWLFAKPLTGLFSADESVIESSTLYLYLVPISYLFLGIIMLSSSAANGIGRPMPSLVMSLLRLIVIFIPLALALGNFFDLAGIYLATSLANIIVGTGALYWVRHLNKSNLKHSSHMELKESKSNA